MFSLNPKLFLLLFLFSQALSAHSVFNCHSKDLKGNCKVNGVAGKDTIHYEYTGLGFILNVVSIDQK